MTFPLAIGIALIGIHQGPAKVVIPAKTQSVFKATMPAFAAMEVDIALGTGQHVRLKGGEVERVLYSAFPNVTQKQEEVKVSAEVVGLVGKPLALPVKAETLARDRVLITIGTGEENGLMVANVVGMT